MPTVSYATIFIIAALPTLGSTVAIPMGIAIGLHPVTTTAVAVAGASCKVPLAIWLANGMGSVAARLPARLPWVQGKLQRAEQRAGRLLHLVRRWGWPALVLCAAVPAPGLGIWTAAVAGRFLGFPWRTTALALVCGLVLAGTALALASVGILVPILSLWAR